jgi:hypothetical protein
LPDLQAVAYTTPVPAQRRRTWLLLLPPTLPSVFASGHPTPTELERLANTFHHLVRGNRPGKPVQLQEYEIKYLCTKAREIFINQPILLELEAPIKICGAFVLRTEPKLLLSMLYCIIRRHPRTILRSAATVRVRWFPARSKLPFPW